MSIFCFIGNVKKKLQNISYNKKVVYLKRNLFLTKMSEKIFIAPRLFGSRFEDHTLPVNILEDFTALEDLLIEVAKGIYLTENPNRKRVPKGFSDGIYLKLVDIDEGSSIAKFAIASAIALNSTLPLENLDSFAYFEKAKNYLAFLAYLLLNLSIRPAVSISLDLPV